LSLYAENDPKVGNSSPQYKQIVSPIKAQPNSLVSGTHNWRHLWESPTKL